MNPRRKRTLLRWALWLGGLGVALSLDWKLVALADAWKPAVRDTEYYNGLRILGTYYPWLVLGLTFWVMDASKRRWFSRVATERAMALMMSPIFAGVSVAVLKILLRRERPELEVGHYVFRPFTQDLFEGGGLGLPSSHTAVAFAGMLTLARLNPPIRYVAWALALGAACQRVISGAHFPSDVYAGATVGALCVSFTWMLHRRFGSGSLLKAEV